MTRITFTLHEGQCTFLITSRLFLLRMRNVSDESCRETQNTHCVFKKFFFPKIVQFMRKCGKNIVQPDRPQMTVWCIRIACWIPKASHAHTHTHTHTPHTHTHTTHTPHTHTHHTHTHTTHTHTHTPVHVRARTHTQTNTHTKPVTSSTRVIS